MCEREFSDRPNIKKCHHNDCCGSWDIAAIGSTRTHTHTSIHAWHGFILRDHINFTW